MGTGRVIQADNIDGLKTVKNFISNGLATLNTTGWATYADAAGTRPVDGTGGSPNVTFTRSTTSPLSEAASFILTKDAANRQGQGASYDFTIDFGYKAKVLKIEADYIVNSGTFVAGSRTTDSDVIVYIYDVTNSTLIEPSSFKFLSNSTTISDKFSATFQTSATGTQYRLIFHVASTSTAAYALKLDNVSVSPSQYVYGTPITDWKVDTRFAFTGVGPSPTVNVTSRRTGDSLQAKGNIRINSTASSLGAVQFTLTGLSIDTNKVPTDTAFNLMPIGTAWYMNAGATSYVGSLYYDGNNGVYRIRPEGGGTSQWTTSTSAGVPSNTAGGDTIKFEMTIPILGWSSSVQVSDGYEGRVIATSAFGSGSIASGTTPNTLNLGTVIIDKTNSLASNAFTVPSAGDYSFTGHFQGNSASGQQYLSIFVDGVEQTSYSSQISMLANGQRQTISGILPLKSGQLVTLRGWQNSGSAVSMNSTFNIQKLAGNPVISATETVACKYFGNSGQSIANTTDTSISYLIKAYDTHGAFNGSIFTAPSSGLYEFVAGIYYTSAATGPQITLVSNNGDPDILFTPNTGTTSASFTMLVTGSFYLNAGQTVTSKTYHNSGASRTLLTDNRTAYFMAKKVK